MTIQQRSYAVFRDDEDNIYAIPREALNSHRVRREWKAKLRQALDGDDVEGFAQTPGSLPAAATTPFVGIANLTFLGMVNIDDPKTAEQWSLAFEK